MREESYEEFLGRIKKINGPKVHKITNSLGIYDMYKYYRKIKPKDSKYVLTETQFFSIINKVHEAMIQELLNGSVVQLPCMFGSLEVRKFIIEPRLDENGRLIFRSPVDLKATLQLWYENEEAHKKHILIKQENRENYKIFYNKYKARYTNKSYFMLKTNRTLRKRVSDAVIEGRLTGFRVILNK